MRPATGPPALKQPARAARAAGALRRSDSLPMLDETLRAPDGTRAAQAYWLENKTFRTPELAELDMSRPKAYILDMFPYPSGAGLHVGHPGMLRPCPPPMRMCSPLV